MSAGDLLRGTLTTQDEHGRCDFEQARIEEDGGNHETQNRRN